MSLRRKRVSPTEADLRTRPLMRALSREAQAFWMNSPDRPPPDKDKIGVMMEALWLRLLSGPETSAGSSPKPKTTRRKR